MTAREALLKYGFDESADGSLMRPNRIKWAEAPGGWERWDWEQGGWDKVPHSVLPEFASQSGLHPKLNPEAFEYCWSDEEIIKIYGR